jgi:hypothetical protein
MKKLKKSDFKNKKPSVISRSKTACLTVLFIVLTVFNFGCQPNQTVLKDVAPAATPMQTVESKKTTLEEDLNEMRTANFGFIFVFRRKDGGEFDKEDQKFLRENTPPETNRWRRSDDGRAFTAGSWYTFSPEQLAALRTRFNVEDYSTPEAKEAAGKAFNAQGDSPANTANKNSNNAVKKNSNSAVKAPANK